MRTIELKLWASAIIVSIAVAVGSAILYVMELPIFSVTALAWTFVVGLVAACTAVAGIALRSAWTDQG